MSIVFGFLITFFKGVALFTLLLLVLSGGLYCWEALQQRYYRLRQQHLVAQLKHLPFFCSLHVGHGYQQVEGCGRVFSDAPIMAIILLRGCPAALIGFSTGLRSFRVLQMQGLKGAKFFGVEANDFLLGCAEHIAYSLGKTHVMIVPAGRQDYFNPPGIEDAGEHQMRMIERYNRTPEGAGYVLEGKWRTKRIGTVRPAT